MTLPNANAAAPSALGALTRHPTRAAGPRAQALAAALKRSVDATDTGELAERLEIYLAGYARADADTAFVALTGRTLARLIHDLGPFPD